VDISHPNALNQFESVQETLEEIHAGHIPLVTALNKIDRLSEPGTAREIVQRYPQSVAISARTGAGLSDLLKLIQQALYETYVPILVRLPYQQGGLISIFHETGQVERIEHQRGGVLMQGRLPGRLVAQFSTWQVPLNNREESSEK
jgi:GTP-binding protein HflX